MNLQNTVRKILEDLQPTNKFKENTFRYRLFINIFHFIYFILYIDKCSYKKIINFHILNE